MEPFYTEISAKKKWFDLNLKEVWQYRDLILLFTRKTFVLNYKQTLLGPLWLILKPFLTSVVFALVFGRAVGVKTGGVPHLLFYLCSNSLWNYFANCLRTNSATFTSNAYVFGKVYFPRLTVPISNVLTQILMLGIQMLMVAVFLLYYAWSGQVVPRLHALWMVPVSVLWLGVMGMSFGIVVSSLTTKYRDLSILVGFGLQLWMYASPIVYPLSSMQDGLVRTILLCNPVSMPVELFRWALLGSGEVVGWSIGLSVGLTVFCTIFGILIFNRVEKNFMDTV